LPELDNIAAAGRLVADLGPALVHIAVQVEHEGVHPVGPAGVGDPGVVGRLAFLERATIRYG